MIDSSSSGCVSAGAAAWGEDAYESNAVAFAGAAALLFALRLGLFAPAALLA